MEGGEPAIRVASGTFVMLGTCSPGVVWLFSPVKYSAQDSFSIGLGLNAVGFRFRIALVVLQKHTSCSLGDPWYSFVLSLETLVSTPSTSS